MTNDLLPTGNAYGYVLLNKWEDLILQSENFRICFLGGTPPTDRNGRPQLAREILITYISSLTRLWLELYAKVKDRNDLGDLSQEFELYSPYYDNPTLLLDPANSDRIFQMERIMRLAMERIGITEFEKGVKV